MATRVATLRDRIEPDRYAAVAFVDMPEVAALDRVVFGGVASSKDLFDAELALRAIALHRTCYRLDEQAESALMNEVPGLIEPFDTPAIEFSNDDPSVPAEIRDEMAAEFLLPMAYEQAQRGSIEGAVGALTYMNGEGVAVHRVVKADGTTQDIPIPSAIELVIVGHRIAQRAQRIVFGDFGGASIWGRGVAVPTLCLAAFERKELSSLLETIDGWYDKRRRAGLPGITLELPPLLAGVLAKAANRDAIPAAIADLKRRFAKPVLRFHELLKSARDAQTPSDAGKAIERIREQGSRLGQLTASADARLIVRLRNMPLDLAVAAASWGTKTTELIAGITSATQAATGLVQSLPGLNRVLTPSLADALFRSTVASRKLVPDGLLQKHLSEEELLALAKEQRI